jgi:hypothetical protein
VVLKVPVARVFDDDRETIHDFTSLGEKFTLAEGAIAGSATRNLDQPRAAQCNPADRRKALDLAAPGN